MASVSAYSPSSFPFSSIATAGKSETHLHTAAYYNLHVHPILSHEDSERKPDQRGERPPERAPAREDGSRDLADGCKARAHAAEGLHLYRTQSSAWRSVR